jgi:hypothetical protein
MSDPNKNNRIQAGDRLLDVVCAGALAWVMPGAGHAIIGCRRHAWVVCGAVGFLWTAGLAIGGLSALDARPAPAGARAWFIAQAGVGPSVFLERVGASMRAGETPPGLALGRGREVATLYLAAAGLLNVMAVADAMLRAGERKPKAPPAGDGAAAGKEVA